MVHIAPIIFAAGVGNLLIESRLRCFSTIGGKGEVINGSESLSCLFYDTTTLAV
jgi:hypothetical protein